MTIRTAAAVIALALAAGSAVAADLPALKSPLPPPPPPPLWNGFYAGLNAGYSWGSRNQVDVWTTQVFDPFGSPPAQALAFFPADSGSTFSALAASGRTSVERNGFIGGGQVGYNRQYNRFIVVGVEADIQGAGIRGENSFSSASAWNGFTLPLGGALGLSLDRSAASLTTVSARTDWLGTVRGRIGYLATPTLLAYLTGGLAYGGVDATVQQSQTIDNTLSLTAGGAPFLSATAPFTSLGAIRRFRDTRVGWTLGGGLEWLLAPNVSVKAEYLYYDLGNVRFWNAPLVSTGAASTLTGFAVPFQGTINQGVTRVNFDGHIARVGLNYHFVLAPPPPVVAKF